MEYTIKNANDYIEKNRVMVNPLYRLKFHMMPPIGWMNDPNGLVMVDNEYHLFYQFHPYEAKWGPMHWGHFISKDLISYMDAPVALAPTNQEIESGCFSGGAIEEYSQIKLVYTRHYEKNDFKSELQCMATSNNGIDFIKENNSLFDNSSLPANISNKDFRDPSVIKVGNDYYLLVGGKLTAENKGIIIVLKSHEMKNFKYDFIIGPFEELGDMGECPSYCQVDGKDIILVSGCNVKEKNNKFKNINSSVYIAGKIDFVNKNMIVESIDEIDKGDTFYAPQFIYGAKKPIMIGWLEMWGKKYPTLEWNHHWAGAFSIPRELRYCDGNLYQIPIQTLENYYTKKYIYKDNNQIIPQTVDINTTIAGTFKMTFEAINGSFKIGQDNQGIYLDTTKANNMNECIRYTNHFYEKAVIRIILDCSSVELFVAGGKEVISSRIYLDNGYKLHFSGKVDNPVVSEIEVKNPYDKD